MLRMAAECSSLFMAVAECLRLTESHGQLGLSVETELRMAMVCLLQLVIRATLAHRPTV
jgi:hypothetical protein